MVTFYRGSVKRNNLTPIQGVNLSMDRPVEYVNENITHSSRLNLPYISKLKDWRGPVAIVGGGPSLLETMSELSQFENTIVCGSAHDTLIKNYIFPKYAVFVDPDPIMSEYVKTPHPLVRYLVASQCHISLFNRLRHQEVYVWHADPNGQADIKFKDNCRPISGGCTVGTRAIFIAMGMGWRDLHLFGFDNCIRDNKHHAYEYQTESENIGKITPITIGDHTFNMADYHVGQLFDFKNILRMFANQIRVTVHGEGALATLMSIAKSRTKTSHKQES
jgi:hypothetical protein